MSFATFRKSGVEFTFQDNSSELKKDMQKAIQKGLEECGKLAKKYAQQELRKPKAHKNGEVRPNIITGDLVDSIDYDVYNNELYVGTDIFYGTFVEFGTRKTWAYPYLTPAMKNHKEQYRNTLKRNILKYTTPFTSTPIE